jgi:hypothetical protein
MSEKEFIFEVADLQNACFDFCVFYLMEYKNNFPTAFHWAAPLVGYRATSSPSVTHS